MRPTTLAAIACTFVCLFAFDTASAALPARALDVDMKQADIRMVFRLLGQTAGREIALDPCVRGTVDLRLRNTPLPLVLDAVAAKLHLSYDDDGAVLTVHCVDDDAGRSESPRLSLTASDAPLADALANVAREARLEGVDYRAAARPKVDVKLHRVRLATALAVLADESGLRITVVNKRLVVTDAVQ